MRIAQKIFIVSLSGTIVLGAVALVLSLNSIRRIRERRPQQGRGPGGLHVAHARTAGGVAWVSRKISHPIISASRMLKDIAEGEAT